MSAISRLPVTNSFTRIAAQRSFSNPSLVPRWKRPSEAYCDHMADVVFIPERDPVDWCLVSFGCGLHSGKRSMLDGCVHDNPPLSSRRIVRAAQRAKSVFGLEFLGIGDPIFIWSPVFFFTDAIARLRTSVEWK